MKIRLAAAGLLFLLMPSMTVLAADPVTVPERSMGKADAPVVVEEFVSFTCPHCAHFYTDMLPEIEKTYVDTGKVRIVLRDFPMDGPGLKAAALARCMPPEMFYPFVEVLFRNQSSWVTAPDPAKLLVQYAKLGGLPEDQAKKCMADQPMLDAIVALRTEDEKKYELNATPSFVFNNGAKKLEGIEKPSEFTAIVDQLLAK